MRRSVAVLSVLALAACQDTTEPTAVPTGTDAQFAASAASDRLERATHAAFGVAGTVFVDDDERVGKVVVGVQSANAVRGVSMAMQAAGFAPGSFEVVQHEPIRNLATLRDNFRPTIGGIQIHFTQYVCTLGFNVTHVASGERSFITNSHCTATQGGTEGTVYYQASSSTSPVVATEVDDPQYFKGGVCPRGKKCRYSDSSRALYNSNATSDNGGTALTTGANNGSLTYSSTFQLAGKATAGVGTTVNKVGRTTGWTRGQVTRTCVNTGVQGSQVMQLCQTFVEAGVDGGDSGSPVFDNNNNLVGILWGGSSSSFVYSPIGQVEQELGSLAIN